MNNKPKISTNVSAVEAGASTNSQLPKGSAEPSQRISDAPIDTEDNDDNEPNSGFQDAQEQVGDEQMEDTETIVVEDRGSAEFECKCVPDCKCNKPLGHTDLKECISQKNWNRHVSLLGLYVFSEYWVVPSLIVPLV